MSKEMYISSSPHETKVAVCEDDLLVELYLERDTDVGLVGGIYKGRVNRVLPGMQSAFVDIGLERDAFLYVSDFSMQGEDFEEVFDGAGMRVAAIEDSRMAAGPTTPAPAEGDTGKLEAAPAKEYAAEEAAPAPTVAEAPNAPASPPAAVQHTSPAHGEDQGARRHEHRGRRRRRRGRGGFGDRKFEHRPEVRTRPAEQQGTGSAFEVLPGESLAKYRHVTESVETSHGPEPAEVQSPGPSSDSAKAEQTEERREALATASYPGETFAEETSAPAQAHDGQHQSVPSADSGGPTEAATPSETETFQAPPSESSSGDTFEPENFPATGDSTEDAQETAGPVIHGAPETGDGAEPAQGDGFPEGVSQETLETAVQPQADEPPAEGQSAQGSQTGDRQSTLRDQHTRPHVAPRRHHRGRRGMRRGRKYEGQREPSRSGNNQPLQISELLKEGQEILVQIAKEPLGTKGARITSHVALPGRYLVYMPTISHIGVSRKISSEQERLRLRNTILEHRGPLTGGFIVRTAAEGRSEEEIKADLRFLTALWTDIRTKAERSRAPAMLYRDLDLVQRLLRDTLTPDFKSVRLDNEIDYERVVEFVSRTQPALLPNVKLHTRETSLFEEYGIQAELEKALRPKVWLKSGGYIVINQTEALVAIDVNTGKYVGKTNRLEDTILKTNIDAVKEIVRQLRLRDLGGIIVVDFIDMDERRNRNRVVQALEEALRHDRAPTKVLAFNEFGLVALTRKRVKQSLQRTLCEPCEYCTGSGWVKSVTTVCNEIFSEARKMAKEIESKTITLRVHPEVARGLKSKEGLLISEIESAVHKDVVIKSDPSIHQEQFEIF